MIPGPIASLQAAPGDGSITLSWATPVDGGSPILGYNIYRSVSPGAETLFDTVLPTNSYVAYPLINETTYYFKVAAFNADGIGQLSGEVWAKPRAVMIKPWPLAIDPITGVLSGTPWAAPGKYPINIVAINKYGTAKFSFDLELLDSPINPYLCTQNLGELRSFMLNGVLGLPNVIGVSDPLITLKGNGGLCSYHVTLDGVQLPTVYRCNIYGSVCIHLHGLSDGQHTISAVEIAPTPGAIAAPYTFTVDTKPPQAPIITQAYYNLTTVVVKGTCVSDIVTIHLNEGPYLRGGAGPVNGEWTVAVLNVPSGPHIYTAIGLDQAGTPSILSNPMTVVVP